MSLPSYIGVASVRSVLAWLSQQGVNPLRRDEIASLDAGTARDDLWPAKNTLGQVPPRGRTPDQRLRFWLLEAAIRATTPEYGRYVRPALVEAITAHLVALLGPLGGHPDEVRADARAILAELLAPASAHAKLSPRAAVRGKALGEALRALRPFFAWKAQEIYDDWDVETDPDADGGGICDLIADALGTVLAQSGVKATVHEGGHEGDHAFLLVYDGREGYALDIPAHVYERGGGYAWTKIPDVTFTPEDVVVAPLDDDTLRALHAEDEAESAYRRARARRTRRRA